MESVPLAAVETTRARSGARSRPFRFLRLPHRQVLALVALSVLVGVGASVSVGRSMGNARASLAPANSNLTTPAAHLAEGELLMFAVAQKFLSSAALPVNERAANAAAMAEEYSQVASAYARFTKESVGLPGEAALSATMPALFEQESAAVIAVLGAAQVSPAQLTAFFAATAALTRTFAQLHAIYADEIAVDVGHASAQLDATNTTLYLAVGGALLVLFVAAAFIYRSVRRSYTVGAAQSRRNGIESEMQRALEMSNDEDGVYAIVGRALDQFAPKVHTTMLVADSSRAHLHQVLLERLAHPDAGCAVSSPTECPAAKRGQTQIFRSSHALDACPYLQTRAGGLASAACVPVSIAGKTVGIIHAITPDEHPPDATTVAILELVGRTAGERVGMLRAFVRSETQAHTDPLTSLLNRRSLEDQVRPLVDDGTQYVVAYGDLDHFKILNDVHGHDAGDKALRMFSRVLRDNVRPSDIPSRYGGEEFVVVLPQCSIDDAVAVIERVRAQLVGAQSGVGGPEFTVSFGLASSTTYETFSETVEAADAALLMAKAAGRDRIHLAGGPSELAEPLSIEAFAAAFPDEHIVPLG